MSCIDTGFETDTPFPGKAGLLFAWHFFAIRIVGRLKGLHSQVKPHEIK